MECKSRQDMEVSDSKVSDSEEECAPETLLKPTLYVFKTCDIKMFTQPLGPVPAPTAASTAMATALAAAAMRPHQQPPLPSLHHQT
jgi:hypothetical protein